jgi:hypothetical protein
MLQAAYFDPASIQSVSMTQGLDMLID